MNKFVYRFFLFFIILITSLIIFLSYFGINTDKFDDIIKQKTNQANQYIKLDFNKTKIYLNIQDLDLAIKLQNPKILINGNEIHFSKLDFFLSLKSFFNSNFLIKKAEIAFSKNDIKDITKITNMFFPIFINNKINKILSKGTMDGELNIFFNKDGSIRKDYSFSGKIVDATINFSKEIRIKNLTTKIKNLKNNSNEIGIFIEKGFIHDIDLNKSEIILKNLEKKIEIDSVIHTQGKINFDKIKKISSAVGLDIKKFKIIVGNINLVTNIKFDLEKKYKLRNLSFKTNGNVEKFEILTTKNNLINKYLPNYNSNIILKDVKIKMENSKSKHNAEFSGLIKINESFDSFKIKETYNPNKKVFNISGLIDLTSSRVLVEKLNYTKVEKEEADLKFDINFILKKYYNINSLSFLSGKNKINLSKIKLNKDYEINNFKKIEVKTFLNKVVNNDFKIENKKKIVANGKVFDAQPILKSLYKKNNKKTLSKNFSSEADVKFDEVLTGTNDIIHNFAMITSISEGSYSKLSSKGNFSDTEIVEISIYQLDEDKKTLQVFSDRARPFVKHFEFIEGFEGGKLQYESMIEKNSSSSNLTINDFKVSKVPALAKLLTLASLRGIADTLSGDGIHFDSFEMKSNSEGNLLNIEDALAMGPAISILLDGYVEKGKVVSLRGTLVPATKLNSIIATIPLLGDILVGKKTGEGVVGVSFKMKGTPKNIKTTVNPIKTLTPRFIVRAIENLKKRKKQKTK